jgi:Sulfotransferase family
MSLTLLRNASKPGMTPPLAHSFFVSIHIPKTAGTTLGSVLDRVYRKRVLMDYPDHVATGIPDPMIAANADFVKGYFKGIHGHFNVQRHLQVFASAKFIATLRHPVNRVISQYLHEMNDDGADSAFHDAITAGMDVVDFACQDGVGDAMTRFLAGLALKDYDLLLMSDRLGESLHVLNYVVGNLDIPQYFGSPPVLPVQNRGAARARTITFDASTRKAIFDKIGVDIDTYRQAEALFAAKIRRHLR